jgi:cytochrome c oxidase subunit 4
MADTRAHPSPNYMAIFWWLAVLTVIEVAVIFTPLPRLVIGILLVALAVSKASLVALYFMHLRFETTTLGLIALSPLVVATLLMFLLVPDNLSLGRPTAESAKIAAPKH